MCKGELEEDTFQKSVPKSKCRGRYYFFRKKLEKHGFLQNNCATILEIIRTLLKN